MLSTIVEEIDKFVRKHETKLERNTNATEIQLLNNLGDIRRLKRLKPYDLVW